MAEGHLVSAFKKHHCVICKLNFENKEPLLECCKERGDLWASEIENRLQGCIDLVAAEARYHDSCLTKFMLKRDPKKKITATGQSLIIFTLQP